QIWLDGEPLAHNGDVGSPGVSLRLRCAAAFVGVRLFIGERTAVAWCAMEFEVSGFIDARTAAELERLAVREVSCLDALDVDYVLRFIELLNTPHGCGHGADIAGAAEDAFE